MLDSKFVHLKHFPLCTDRVDQVWVVLDLVHKAAWSRGPSWDLSSRTRVLHCTSLTSSKPSSLSSVSTPFSPSTNDYAFLQESQRGNNPLSDVWKGWCSGRTWMMAKPPGSWVQVLVASSTSCTGSFLLTTRMTRPPREIGGAKRSVYHVSGSSAARTLDLSDWRGRLLIKIMMIRQVTVDSGASI